MKVIYRIALFDENVYMLYLHELIGDLTFFLLEYWFAPHNPESYAYHLNSAIQVGQYEAPCGLFEK